MTCHVLNQSQLKLTPGVVSLSMSANLRIFSIVSEQILDVQPAKRHAIMLIRIINAKGSF